MSFPGLTDQIYDQTYCVPDILYHSNNVIQMAAILKQNKGQNGSRSFIQLFGNIGQLVAKFKLNRLVVLELFNDKQTDRRWTDIHLQHTYIEVIAVCLLSLLMLGMDFSFYSQEYFKCIC